MLKVYWEYVTNQAKQIAPNVGLDTPFSAIEQVENQFSFQYVFHAGFPVRQTTEQVKTGVEHYKSGERRVWWKLWLVKEDVYSTRPVYENRSYDTAEIPSAYDLLKNWIDQAKLSEPDVVNSFVNWLRTQTASASSTLRQTQKELLDRYQVKLDEAHKRAAKIHEAKQQDWGDVYKQAEELRNGLILLNTLKMDETADVV
jgi:hypothetical protein